MESSEIQDFLQAEKAMLSDTIKELEKEVCYLWYVVIYFFKLDTNELYYA